MNEYKRSAQKIIEAMRLHYNFCREHSKLSKTPAEASGIKIEGENKLASALGRHALAMSTMATQDYYGITLFLPFFNTDLIQNPI